MGPALALELLLGLLWGLQGILGDPGGPPRVLHSLHYLSVAVSEPSLGVPQFMALGFVDGIPFTRYDSERGRVEPQTQWMEEGAEPGYWERQTQICQGHQHVDARNLETLRHRYNQSGGLHTIQWLYSCDLLSDGSVRGSQRLGYDGRDFISFELGSKSFVAADDAAEITRRHWEDENEVERQENNLKHVCPEWLRKYVRYGQKELERKEPTYGGNLDMVIAVSVIAAVLILVLIGFGIWRLQSGRRDRIGYNPPAGKNMGINI